MNESNMALHESERFYKVNSDGRWHRKTERGCYEEMKDRSVLKRLQVLTAKSPKRIE